jgi:hypothetical protein
MRCCAILNELIHQHGEIVRTALNALLCNPERSIQPVGGVSLAESGAKPAITELVPLLVNQYKLSPGAALLVATLVIKTVTVHGENVVCEELSRQHRKTARNIRHSVKSRAEKNARISARKKQARIEKKLPSSDPH